MEFYNIVKDGVTNTVDAGQYESIYKPAGWRIIREQKINPVKISKAEDEERFLNTEKMKKSKPKKFSDGLIKDD